MHRRLVLSIGLVVCCLQLSLRAESRIGMYCTVLNSEGETAQFIAKCHAAGVATLYPSLCGGSTVVWKTDREDYYVSMRDKLAAGYDPLEVFIRQAHAAGMKVYPSVVCGFGGRILRDHPEWETRDRNGQPSSKTASAYFSFAIPEARAAKIALFMDLVNGYDIDGLFLDECNYPVSSVSAETKYGFYGYDGPLVDACKSLFGFDPAKEAIDSENWKVYNKMKAETVTAFVRELRTAVKGSKPNVRLGGYADVDPDMEMRSCGRDYATWCRRGYVDDLFLATYVQKVPEMKTVVSHVRQVIGNDVKLYSSLCPFNEFLKTNAEMVSAANAQLAGKADGLWVYRDDFVDKLKLWDGVQEANAILVKHAGGKP